MGVHVERSMTVSANVGPDRPGDDYSFWIELATVASVAAVIGSGLGHRGSVSEVPQYPPIKD